MIIPLPYHTRATTLNANLTDRDGTLIVSIFDACSKLSCSRVSSNALSILAKSKNVICEGQFIFTAIAIQI